MPVHIDTITSHNKSLDEKIFDFLAVNRDQFYTHDEIQDALGDSDSLVAMLAAVFLENVALAAYIGKRREDRNMRYNFALLGLVLSERIEHSFYKGAPHYGVSQTLSRRMRLSAAGQR